MGSKAHLNQVIASHLVEIRAEESPDRQVFIFERGEHGEDILTYRKLYENSNKIASLFVKKGLGAGDNFAILMRNHPEFVYSMLAGTTTGSVMVPIDPRNRGERLKYMINNSQSKAVVVSGECLDQLEEVLKDTPSVKHVMAVYLPEQNVPVSPKYEALNGILDAPTWDVVEQKIFDVRHPMQIVYTSGTTGEPKGVMVRNNRTGMYNILTSLVWRYKKDDVLYTGLSLTHGNAQAVTFFPALSLGIRAVISPRFTKSRIWDICRKYGCTSFSLLGGMMAAIFNEPARSDDANNPVKVVLSAGTPPAVWDAFEKRFDVRILEWYGSVEGGFAYKPVGQGPVGSFGKTIPGILELKVVDESDNDLPTGATGELICRMTKGETKVDYLGLPDASREKTRGGWLRTGDMVHKDKDGWLFFDYRRGTELRRSGDFIQPDYVEMIIGKQPQVSEVCVYGIPAASGAPGESDLVAAVELFEGKSIEPGPFFAELKKELQPNFMPSYLQIVAALPKTITEKPLARELKEEFEQNKGTLYRLSDFS